MPSLFVPLFTSSGVAGSFSSVNTEEGNLILKMQTDLVYYSNFDIEEPLSMIDAALFNKAGVDLTGEAGFPINDMASLRVGGRVPIVPGRINTASYVTMNYLIDTSVTGIADTEIQSDELTVVTSETVYYSNRPLKASAYMDIAPMGDAVTFSFGGGVGIRHPFTP